MNETLYPAIYKRKSFHLFRDTGPDKLTEKDIQSIQTAYKEMTPLYPDIRTALHIVPANEKLLGRGAEYAIEIYSEKKENYLLNAGYLGQQLDLWLVSKNIGSLWFGLGKPAETARDGLSFVIMILVAKVDDAGKFRKDMFKAKRLPAEEVWRGAPIPGVTEIARFAPSACNSQPWRIKREGQALTVTRYRKPGRIGIMPAFAAGYFNCVDMGIYLCILELCLAHEHIAYSRELYVDTGDDRAETLIARYLLSC